MYKSIVVRIKKTEQSAIKFCHVARAAKNIHGDGTNQSITFC